MQRRAVPARARRRFVRSCSPPAHAALAVAPVSEPAGSEVRAVDVLLVVKPADGQRFPMQARWQEAVVTMRSAGVKVETIDGTNGHLVSQVSICSA